MKIKKILSAVLATLIICLPFYSTTAMAAETPDTSYQATSIYLKCLNTGQVLYQNNADEQLSPASLTKVMTAIVVLENCDDLDNTMVTAPDYIYDQFYGLNVSTANILAGESYSVRDLLYCLLLQSANEAAAILADYFGNGSEATFLDMMNAKAKELGCTNTNFANPHGLDEDNHYTSAHDMAIMAEYAMNDPVFYEIVTSTRWRLEATPQQPARTLVSTVYPQDIVNGGSIYNQYIEGIKTGTTDSAGKCYVSEYKRDGLTFLCVVMGCHEDTTPNPAFVMTNELYDWAYNNFDMVEVVTEGESIHEAKIKYSFKYDSLLLSAKDSLSLLLPSGSDSSTVQRTITLKENPLKATVNKGDVVGSVTLKLDGETVGTIDLVASKTVERNWILFVATSIKSFLTSTPVKIILGILLVLVLLYLVLAFRSYKAHRFETTYKKHRRINKKKFK